MAITRPNNHFERKRVLTFTRDFFTSPDADADLTLLYNRGFADTVVAILARCDAQARSQVTAREAYDVLAAANVASDGKLRTLSMHTSMSRGPDALAELERTWGGHTRSELTALPHARQVAALDQLFAAVDAGLVLPVSEAHLAKVRAANDTMSAALNEAARAAAAAKADTEALNAVLPTFDAGWGRLAARAKELLGDKVSQLVPDLSAYRKGTGRARPRPRVRSSRATDPPPPPSWYASLRPLISPEP